MPPKRAAAASKATSNTRAGATKSKAGGGVKTTAKTVTAAAAPKKKVGRPPKKEAEEPKVKPKTAPPATSRKRKAATPDEEPAKKARVAKTPPVVKKKAEKPKVVINEPPTEKLDVYVCGEGSSGELGLGTEKKAVDVKRPRLNPLLPADTVGVVQLAVGGMHCLALTHDNKILTWGVNDQGALGRDTAWEGGYKDMDAASDSGSDDSGSDSGLNPREAVPTQIPADAFPEGTRFVQVAAGDSSSFALTDDGLVYGWGTFRSNDGIFGFDPKKLVQTVPVLIPSLKMIKHVNCGDNHVLAVNDKGAVFAWGSGEQSQLGRRILERNKLHALQPRQFGLPKNIVHVGSGAFHSFAVHESGKVYSWGLNNFGETGIPQGTGEAEAVIVRPTVVKSLTDRGVVQVCGGSHHSMARTVAGECLVWGRLDGSQTGLKIASLPDDDLLRDERNRPRILTAPTAVPDIEAAYIAAGAEHSIAVGKDGRLWSWGFSANYQTGQGTDDDVEIASVVENTAVRGKKLTWAGAGGQFSVFAGPAVKAPVVNGV